MPVDNYPVPTYRTGGRLFTREQLCDLFRREWGAQISHADVDSYLLRHFAGRNGVEPTAMIPFPPMPDLPDSMDDRDYARAIQSHKDRRTSSKRARQLFDVNNLPVYVPSLAWPSDNDSDRERAKKVAKLESVNPEV